MDNQQVEKHAVRLPANLLKVGLPLAVLGSCSSADA
jgi:hypothetical protein